MAHANHVDRRQTQTQERYAADDLETMQEARRYSAHLFNLFRAHIGTRVLEVGSGIGTMTRPLADAADARWRIVAQYGAASRAARAIPTARPVAWAPAQGERSPPRPRRARELHIAAR